MKRRTMIRILSFAAVAAAVLLARNIMLMKKNKSVSLSLQSAYMRALEELSTAADNISNTLHKQLYAGTADMNSKLSQQLWRDASTAKAALAQLPTDDLQLENTYKFLSQVGNYSLAMSEKLRSGEKPDEKEYEKLSKLYEFSKQLCDDMWALEGKISDGSVPLGDISEGAGQEEEPPTVSEGFVDFEEGFDSYPTLIYDGPFSDHILEKTPIMTKGKEEISQQTAQQRASGALDTDLGQLTEVIVESGRMPSYIFSDKDGTVACAVTKQGGYISYFLKNRDVLSENISVEEALSFADKCLDDLGLNNMRRTYYENMNHIMTVNYAYYEGDVCCYTDLIKVSVSMDTGEIVGYDARGYLVNHQHRSFPEKQRSEGELKKQLSPKLKVLSTGLAVIPSDSQDEIFCREFKCEAPDGTHVLVYFNAETGKEEQILILFESESGTLTM